MALTVLYVPYSLDEVPIDKLFVTASAVLAEVRLRAKSFKDFNRRFVWTLTLKDFKDFDLKAKPKIWP